MKRRFQVLALCATALIAVHMMAQDNGGAGGTMGGGDASGASGASGGASSSDNSGASGGASSTNGGNSTNEGGSNGNTNGQGSLPNGGAGDQNGGGMSTTPSANDLFGPGTGTEGTGEGGSSIVPAVSPSPSPGTGGAAPGVTPTPTPTPTPNPFSPNTVTPGATQAAPVTFSLPGAYGGGVAQSFTLGEGRLAKPPLTFSLSVSQGYNDNIYSADSHIVPTPTPIPLPTPPLEERLVDFRINPPSPPTPVFVTFRPKASPTPAVPNGRLGVVGSPVSTLSLGVQIQRGTPRTVLTLDASLGLTDNWNEPDGQSNFTGSLDAAFEHRLTPRATLSIEASAAYQQTPNFALINAPTTNSSNQSYVNGNAKIDLSYAWSSRISTVTSYSLSLNLLQSGSNNLYDNTYGTQFRYTVSARNTVTAELRQEQSLYPTNSALNSTTTYYLLGLDSFISARLRNTFSTGFETQSGSTATGRSLPYFESATTLVLPRGASLSWTNRYGSEQPTSPGQSVTSYRTSLTYGQPLSTKLSASVSLAYNNVDDSGSAADTSTQQQIQLSLSLGYTVTPRFSLSLSYTYNDLLSSQVNSSYQADQIFLGGSYTFQ